MTEYLLLAGAMLLTGAVGGVLAGLLGIGGGTLSVATLTLFNQPIHRAVGTAAFLTPFDVYSTGDLNQSGLTIRRSQGR